MIKLLKQILKKTEYYDFVRNLYLICFRKGFFYHYVQKYFVKIRFRRFLGKIEKKIVILFNPGINREVSRFTDFENINAKSLEIKGVTNPFLIKAFRDNKNEIVSYFLDNKIFYEKYKNENLYSLKEKPEDMEIGYYENTVTSKCPYLFDIVNDEIIVKSLSSYFKAPFKLDYVNCWWSFSSIKKKVEKTQNFHRDLDNFNFAKVFLYLSDIDVNAGPHQYVYYSHNKQLEKKISRKVMDENQINKENIFTFTGEAGSAIIADTFGIHRGLEPFNKNRLMMVLSYSLVNTYFSPKKSFLKEQDIKFNNDLGILNRYILKGYLK